MVLIKPGTDNTEHCLPCAPRPPFLNSPPQFIPKFLAQSKRRTKELAQALRDMPKVFSNDNELWEEFRKVVSTIREELKDLLTFGSNRAITGQDESMDIIPHVTGMYKAYATGIRDVGWLSFCCFPYVPRGIVNFPQGRPR